MNIASTKLELAKQLLNTDDINIINHLKAIFITHSAGWWESLPEKIQHSVTKALKQSEQGISIPHDKVIKKYKKWPKK